MGNGCHGKGKADQGVDGESSRRRIAINSNNLQVDPYLNARHVFLNEIHAPAEFMCALSKTIMSDPVNLSTGQIVDRSAFNNLFDVMPQDLIDQATGVENLSSATMTRNVKLRTLIRNWCESKQKAELRYQFIMLSNSREYQVASARELRSLVKDSPEYAKAFAYLGSSSVLQLFRPLMANDLLTHSSMHEDILVVAARLSKYHPNRELFVQHEIVIYIILESQRCGSLEARLSAMSLVYYISTVPSCRSALVRSGIIEHLSDILKSGSVLVMNRAVGTLCKLCNESEYRQRAICNGVIDSISHYLTEVHLTDKYSYLLYKLSLDEVGLQQLAASENIHKWLLHTLLNTIKARVQEICLVTLFKILPVSKAAFSTTLEHEIKYNLITEFSLTGSHVSKKVARVILESLMAKQSLIQQLAASSSSS